jgi:hypothetical protein
MGLAGMGRWVSVYIGRHRCEKWIGLDNQRFFVVGGLRSLDTTARRLPHMVSVNFS